MRLIQRTSVILGAAFLLSMASTAVRAAEETPMSIPGGTYVSTAQAKDLFDKGALFIDSRVTAEYAEEHIKGAVGIVYKEKHSKVSKIDPEDTMDMSKLPSDKTKVLVFYCNGSPCWRGYKGATMAIKSGYSKVHWYRDGIPAWKAAGHTVQ
ncbi:MAG: rhodanese [Betaproteobacteria bacterium HGW-Betaproteobacteria-6]|jgi:rhodanese-related sulfurtransferase|nr:MAG: rhodanese [Betaproteobacteria bacterium HGW-Betaproteobacteria-6]